MQLGQFVHAVIVLSGIEREGNQHRVVDRADFDAMAAKHGHVVLDVLADLQDCRVFQQGLQLGECGLERDLVRQELAVACTIACAAEVQRALSFAALCTVGEREVGRAPLGRIDVAPWPSEQGERDTDQRGIVGVQSVSLAIESNGTGLGRLGYPLVEQLLVADQFVVGGREGLVRLGARGCRLGRGGVGPFRDCRC